MARHDRQFGRRSEVTPSTSTAATLSGSTLTRVQAMRGPALVGAVALGSAGLLHFYDPHSAGSYGTCPFLYLTGLPCPGCGGLRAINDLTRFDLGAALSSNILAVALVVVLVVAFVRWIPKRWRGENARMIVLGPMAGYVAIGLLFVFGVVRNTPWGSWMAP